MCFKRPYFVLQDEKAQLLLTYLWLRFVSTNMIHKILSFILCIYYIILLMSHLLTTVLLFQSWINEFASWDPVQCNAERISLPRTKFWVPDIVINELWVYWYRAIFSSFLSLSITIFQPLSFCSCSEIKQHLLATEYELKVERCYVTNSHLFTTYFAAWMKTQPPLSPTCTCTAMGWCPMPYHSELLAHVTSTSTLFLLTYKTAPWHSTPTCM